MSYITLKFELQHHNQTITAYIG